MPELVIDDIHVAQTTYTCPECNVTIKLPALRRGADPEPEFPFDVEHVSDKDHRLTKR